MSQSASTSSTKLTTGKTMTPKTTTLAIATETCICDRCEREIPQTHIVKKILNPRDAVLTQRVRAWCESCGCIYQLDRTLRGGVWEPVSGVIEITDEHARRGMISRIEHVQGVVQTRNQKPE
jgi:hypothetical protein